MNTRSPIVSAATAYASNTLPDLLDLGSATSPLIPWTLAALVAPAAKGGRRASLEEALGLPAEQAQSVAGDLLRKGPTALRTALSFWRHALLASDGDLGDWEGTLPAGTRHGPVPDQATADAWTRRETMGLIREFPARITPDLVAILAAAMATKVRWDWPLEVVPAPANAWNLRSMLAAYCRGIYETPAGDVGVAEAYSQKEGLAVFSFIADPSVERGNLARAALGLVADWHAHAPSQPKDPATLPREGHAWTIEEGYDDPNALVPAFAESASGVDIGSLPAVREAAEELRRMGEEAAPRDLRPITVKGVMSAVAQYDRLGFEAAAFGMMTMAAMSAAAVKHPVVHLRFARPHLAIAVATDRRFAGLPLFAAWVDAGVREPEA